MKLLSTIALLLITSSWTLAAAPIKIVLVGDSTVEEKAGWGPGFAKLLDAEVTCVNRARSGRSSKSFINEGLWKKALAEKPDYVLIQFGHNDQPGKGPERETNPATTYPQWMAHYVDESRAIGAKPILVTSLARRIFGRDGKITSNLTPYADAVKKLAEEKKVPVIDLHALSIALLDKIGPEAAKEFDYQRPVKPGEKPIHDGTHLSPKGSEVMGRLVAVELKKVAPELAGHIKAE